MSRRLIATNSLWLIGDKVVRLGLGLAVWLWLARQFGAEAFGQWNYALALTSLFAAVASLGLDGIVQKELLSGKHDRDALLGSAIALRLCAGVASACLCIVMVVVLRPGQSLIQALVVFSTIVFVLQSTQVIDWYFQSEQRNRVAVIAANTAFLAATALRLVLLWCESPLLWIGATLVLEAGISAALLVLAARSSFGSPVRWRGTMQLARHLLKESWPMLLSGMAVTLYMRVDQLMLAAMLGDRAVGQFSAALRISEVWYFVPMSIMAAAFPSLMLRRQGDPRAYEAYLQKLYDGMAWLGIGVAVAASLSAGWLVEHLYGAAYTEAARILQIQIWAGVAVAMSFVHGKWLLAEGLQRMGLFYTCVGCIVNLGLNLVLIPRFGAVGAAWATLASQVGVLPIQLVFAKGRTNFLRMVKVVSAPLRYGPLASR